MAGHLGGQVGEDGLFPPELSNAHISGDKIKMSSVIQEDKSTSVVGRGAAHFEHSLSPAVLCGQPPAVPDGKVEGTDFHWGASISYSCADGFQLSHSAILSCEGHGVWKGEVPQCLRKFHSSPCP